MFCNNHQMVYSHACDTNLMTYGIFNHVLRVMKFFRQVCTLFLLAMIYELALEWTLDLILLSRDDSKCES